MLLALLLAAAGADESLPLETVAQLGHASDIAALAYSADGRYLVSADAERAFVWEVRSGRLLRTFSYPYAAGISGKSAALSADGSRLTVFGRVFDVRTGKLLFKLAGAPLVSSDGQFAAGPGGIYEVATGQRRNPFPRIADCQQPLLLDIASQGKRLAVQCTDEKHAPKNYRLRVVDAETGARVAQPHVEEGGYQEWKASFSPDGKLLGSIWDTSTFLLTDMETGQDTASFPVGNVAQIGFRPGPQPIVGLFGDSFLGSYRVAAIDPRNPQKPLWEIKSETIINAGAFSPGGDQLVFGGVAKLVQRAEAIGGKPLPALASAIEEVQSLAFLPDGRLIVQGRQSWLGTRGSVRVWDLEAGKQTEVFEGHNLLVGQGATLAVARGQPLGQELTTSQPISTRVLELPGGKERFARTFTPDKGFSASGEATLSPKGTFLFVNDKSGESSGSFAILEAKTGKELLALPKRNTSYSLLGVDASETTAMVMAPLPGEQGEGRTWEYLLIDLPGARVVKRFSKDDFGGTFTARATDDGAFWAVAQSAGSGDETYLIVVDGKTGETREVRAKSSLGANLRLLSGRMLYFDTPLGGKSGKGRRLHALDLGTLKEPWTLKLAYDAAQVDGAGTKLLVTETRNVDGVDLGQLHLVDAATGKEKLLFKTRGELTAVFSANRQQAAVQTQLEDGRATTLILELATGATLADLHETFLQHAAAFSADGAQLATVDATGKVALHALPSGKLQATLFSLRDREWAISAPDGSYAASKGATRSVQFVRGMKIYTFENFDLRFNRPDRVLQSLGRSSQAAVSSIERAWEKRVRRMGFVPAQVGQDLHLPELTFNRAQLPPPETAERKVSLRAHAGDAEAALDRVNLYVNEVPIFGERGRALEGHDQELTLEVPLISGRNSIQLSVTNAKGAESLRETFEVNCTAPRPPAKLVLVAIGVSQYADARMNLSYAAKDAQDLATQLSSTAGKIEVLSLLDGAATKEAIVAAHAKLQATQPEDEVVIFYAGHGLLDDKLDYYLATPGVDFESPAAMGLPYEALEGLLDGVPALRRLILVDACHSGELDKEDVVLVAAAVQQGQIRSRGFKTVKSRLGEKSAADLASELFADLRRGSGAIVIASASGTELASESGAWKNGAFTYATIEGLKSGKVRVSELRDYVTARVKELTSGLQTPTSRRENLAFDFSIY